MPFTLADIVPWGRSFEEYRLMFGLEVADLAGRIVGCADGSGGFNADATRRGVRVVSCAPLYAFDRAAIAARIDAAFEEVMAETRRNVTEFVWQHVASPDEPVCAALRAPGLVATIEPVPYEFQRGGDRMLRVRRGV